MLPYKATTWSPPIQWEEQICNPNIGTYRIKNMSPIICFKYIDNLEFEHGTNTCILISVSESLFHIPVLSIL